MRDLSHQLGSGISAIFTQAPAGSSWSPALNATATDKADNSITSACSMINQFIALITSASGKSLTVEQANALISTANQVKSL